MDKATFPKCAQQCISVLTWRIISGICSAGKLIIVLVQPPKLAKLIKQVYKLLQKIFLYEGSPSKQE